jgi:hypothetical protein
LLGLYSPRVCPRNAFHRIEPNGRENPGHQHVSRKLTAFTKDHGNRFFGRYYNAPIIRFFKTRLAIPCGSIAKGSLYMPRITGLTSTLPWTFCTSLSKIAVVKLKKTHKIMVYFSHLTKIPPFVTEEKDQGARLF